MFENLFFFALGSGVTIFLMAWFREEFRRGGRK